MSDDDAFADRAARWYTNWLAERYGGTWERIPSQLERKNNLGIRGGTTLSRDHAEEVIRKWKGDEFGWLQARMLSIAFHFNELHGDYLEHVYLSNRNLIGIAFVNLKRQGFITVKLDERGVEIRRASKAAARHGGDSNVYVLTDRGRDLAGGWTDELWRIAEATAPLDPPQTQLDL